MLVVPLASSRVLEWLRARLGNVVAGRPVLSQKIIVSREEAVSAARRSTAGVFTSPTAVSIVGGLLPRSLLANVLGRAYAIGPLTANELEKLAARKRLRAVVKTARPNSSAGLIRLLDQENESHSLSLWCSTAVNPVLEAKLKELGGVVVKSYEIVLDEKSIDEISGVIASSPEDVLLVFTSRHSVLAWERVKVRIGSELRLRAAVISERVAEPLLNDESIAELLVFKNRLIDRFPDFVAGALGT